MNKHHGKNTNMLTKNQCQGCACSPIKWEPLCMIIEVYKKWVRKRCEFTSKI